MATPTSDTAGIRQAIRALRAAGWELSSVWDGEESYGVQTETEAIDALTAVDVSWLYVGNLDWECGREQGVMFVMGNDPAEVICDYHVGLDDVLGPLISSWDY